MPTHVHEQKSTGDCCFHYQKDDWLSCMQKNVKTVAVNKMQTMG